MIPGWKIDLSLSSTYLPSESIFHPDDTKEMLYNFKI